MIREAKKAEYIRRLILARMRLLNEQGFYGLLLMHMEFALDESMDTAATDGKKIYFSPVFIDDLSDDELIFVLMHEVLHVALKHPMRCGEREHLIYNIACDIVVNSNILRSCDMKTSSITLGKYGESMHKAPDGREGYEYTAEEVYDMLMSRAEKTGSTRSGKGEGHSWDDHSAWGNTYEEEAEQLDALWDERVKNAATATRERNEARGCGKIPVCADRILKELKEPQTDWRTILNDFVQEDITDYSFTPPDRRFSESDFFLPDFNEKDQSVKDILFMIDASGSMSDDDVTAAYSEVKGALEQFDGKLAGWLGFFDASVVKPIPFSDVSELMKIRPKGGGGTSFSAVFKYVRKNMEDNLPASIIMLTDGFCEFPRENAAMGIPVLWLINNDKIDPPWGKVARLKN